MQKYLTPAHYFSHCATLLRTRPWPLSPRPWWFLIWLPSFLLLLEVFEVNNSMLSDALGEQHCEVWLVGHTQYITIFNYILALQQYMCLQAFGTSQVTQRCIKVLDMCEILATHFRLPSDLGGTPHFWSLGRRWSLDSYSSLTATAQTHDIESTNTVLLFRTEELESMLLIWKTFTSKATEWRSQP